LKGNMAETIQSYLAVPDKFRETALAFPDKIKSALALVETQGDAADLLDKAEVLSQFARRIRSDAETINAIQFGKLLVTDKFGELLKAPTPQESGKRGGRGHEKGSSPGEPPLAKATAATYRKVHEHGPSGMVYWGHGTLRKLATWNQVVSASNT